MELRRLFRVASLIGVLAVGVPALAVPTAAEAATGPRRPAKHKKARARRSVKKAGHRKTAGPKRRAR